MRPLLAIALLAVAGCATPAERPDAVVIALARFDLAGEWDMARAEDAASGLGYTIADRGTHGFMTTSRDGHTLFAASPDGEPSTSQLSVAYRIDDADVCSAASYDQWVDALLADLAPQARSRAQDFAAATGWSVGEPEWEVTASDATGALLSFPGHCGTIASCVGDACTQGSRWQDRPYAGG